jgi:hypothetical protein
MTRSLVVRQCFRAFWAERAFPSSVRGPVQVRAVAVAVFMTMKSILDYRIEGVSIAFRNNYYGFVENVEDLSLEER